MGERAVGGRVGVVDESCPRMRPTRIASGGRNRIAGRTTRISRLFVTSRYRASLAEERRLKPLAWPMSGLLSERYIPATSLVLSEADALARESQTLHLS